MKHFTQVYVIRWCPSQCSVDPIEEIILKNRYDVIKKVLPYNMIYWRGIYIGNWRFYAKIASIKSAILFQSEHAQWHVAQITNIKFAN